MPLKSNDNNTVFAQICFHGFAIRYYLLAAVILCLSPKISAQEIVIIGQVLSATDATPLTAAHVWFKGTNTGTVTNNEGFFMLRSRQPQKTLSVSVTGYKSRNISLDYGKDQMLHILLKEDISLLDEILVLPNQDEAITLLKRVHDKRHINNPENILDIETDITTETHLNLTDIKEKAFRRRLFKQLQSGAIAQSDTNYSLPVYISQTKTRFRHTSDSVSETNISDLVNAIHLLPEEQWQQFIDAYKPDINLYKPYSTVLGSNFMSPVARSAKLYYNLYLADSLTNVSGNKTYQIRFKPKIPQSSLFAGELWIDSASAAIISANITIPDNITVNYLNRYNYIYTTEPLQNIHYPVHENQFLGLQLNPLPIKESPFFGAALSHSDTYSDTRLLTDSITVNNTPILSDTLEDDGVDALWNRIDSVNQTRIQRLAAWTVDIVLNQYLHIWKIDLGPLPNLFHYNRYEGASPQLSLRSNEKFARYFTFGGYYSYGFTDKQHKYGANIKWRFGPTHRNYLSFYYDHHVERYGYDDLQIYDEGRVHALDHIFSSLEQRNKYPVMALRKRMMLDYVYERKGFKFHADLRAEKLCSNTYMPFIQNGKIISHMNVLALRADIRLSWRENSLDNYFHRIYLHTNYPIVHLTTETGIASVGSHSGFYGKFGIYAKQRVPVGFGRLNWTFQANAVVGNVPFPLLVMPHSSRGSYFHRADFALLNQMELISDMYCQLNLRYQTRGYIFGYIPYIQKIGIREDLIFNIGYGHLRPEHNHVLKIPSNVSPWNNIPYIEAGFGFSNILHLADIEFIWRITHRNAPSSASLPASPDFAVRWRLSLGF